MKKQVRKLSLNRETVRQLSESQLQVIGRADQQDTGDDTGPIFTGPFYGGCPSYGSYCTVTCSGC